LGGSYCCLGCVLIPFSLGIGAGFKKFGGDKYKDPEKNKETHNMIKKAFKSIFKIFLK
jgi:hypothetical protein